MRALACVLDPHTAKSTLKPPTLRSSLIRKQQVAAFYVQSTHRPLLCPPRHYSFKRKLDDMGDRALRRYEGRIMVHESSVLALVLHANNCSPAPFPPHRPSN